MADLRGTPTPLDQNFFIFVQFLGKICQIIGWRPLRGWRTPWEILDPPLLYQMPMPRPSADISASLSVNIFQHYSNKLYNFNHKIRYQVVKVSPGGSFHLSRPCLAPVSLLVSPLSRPLSHSLSCPLSRSLSHPLSCSLSHSLSCPLSRF